MDSVRGWSVPETPWRRVHFCAFHAIDASGLILKVRLAVYG